MLATSLWFQDLWEPRQQFRNQPSKRQIRNHYNAKGTLQHRMRSANDVTDAFAPRPMMPLMGGGRLQDNTTSWKIPKPRKWLLQLRRPENADSTTSALHVGGYLNRRPFWRMKR